MEPVTLSLIAVEMMKAAAAALASGVLSRLLEVVWPPARASGVERELESVARGTTSRAEEEAVRTRLASEESPMMQASDVCSCS